MRLDDDAALDRAGGRQRWRQLGGTGAHFDAGFGWDDLGEPLHGTWNAGMLFDSCALRLGKRPNSRC